MNEEFGSVKNTISGWFNNSRPEVHPTDTFSTTRATKGHPAQLVTDTHKNTFWAVPVARGGKEAEVTVHFQSKINLKNIVVYNGNAADYKGTNRPQQLHMVFDNNQATDVNLDDVPDKQTKNVSNANGITEIKIFIANTYTTAKAKQIAISEIEFFKSD